VMCFNWTLKKSKNYGYLAAAVLLTFTSRCLRFVFSVCIIAFLSCAFQVRCAVKTLKESVRSNMYEVDKFRREASMLRSLRHPGVLRVIAVNDAKFAIAIEIMAGGSLHSLLHGTSQVLLVYHITDLILPWEYLMNGSSLSIFLPIVFLCHTY
jgi:serine/threonine protein kinase